MPLSPFERIRLDKAAVDEGFGIRRADDGDWLAYESLGAPAAIRLTAVPEGYVAAVDHNGVAADLSARWPPWEGKAPAGFTALVVPDTAPLHELVGEMWRLARALPLAPLREFEKRTGGLPRTTEAERRVVQRVGQDVFRGALMDYWDGRCAVTGCAEPCSCARATSGPGPCARPAPSDSTFTMVCCWLLISMPRSTPA